MCSCIRKGANSEIITRSFIFVTETETLKAKIVPQCLWWGVLCIFTSVVREAPTDVMANEYEIVMMRRVCGSWSAKPR